MANGIAVNLILNDKSVLVYVAKEDGYHGDCLLAITWESLANQNPLTLAMETYDRLHRELNRFEKLNTDEKEQPKIVCRGSVVGNLHFEQTPNYPDGCKLTITDVGELGKVEFYYSPIPNFQYGVKYLIVERKAK